MNASAPNIIEFVTDPQLLNLRVSVAQETLLRGIYCLPLPRQEHRDVWALCTGGRPYHEGRQYPEVTNVSGARGGKDSRINAPCVVYEGVFGGHDKHLGRGERATIPLVSQDARANATARGYVFSYLRESPVLRSRIEDETRDALVLNNRVTVLCLPTRPFRAHAWSGSGAWTHSASHGNTKPSSSTTSAPSSQRHGWTTPSSVTGTSDMPFPAWNTSPRRTRPAAAATTGRCTSPMSNSAAIRLIWCRTCSAAIGVWAVNHPTSMES